MDDITVDTSEVTLEGEMQLPGGKPEPQRGQLSTLDEPVSTTIVCRYIVFVDRRFAINFTGSNLSKDLTYRVISIYEAVCLYSTSRQRWLNINVSFFLNLGV